MAPIHCCSITSGTYIGGWNTGGFSLDIPLTAAQSDSENVPLVLELFKNLSICCIICAMWFSVIRRRDIFDSSPSWVVGGTYAENEIGSVVWKLSMKKSSGMWWATWVGLRSVESFEVMTEGALHSRTAVPVAETYSFTRSLSWLVAAGSIRRVFQERIGCVGDFPLQGTAYKLGIE